MKPLSQDRSVHSKPSEATVIEQALIDAARGRIEIRRAARHIAECIAGYGWDWRHLARALDAAQAALAVREDTQATTAMEAPLPRLIRVAVLASRHSLPSGGLAPQNDGTAVAMRLREVAARRQTGASMLRGVLGVLREVMPFHVATYTEYCYPEGGMPLARARFSVDGATEFDWPARWLATPASLIRWAAGEQRWIADIEEFYEKQPDAAAMRSGPVIQEYERRGLGSFVIVPRRDGERLLSTLTLARRLEDGTSPFAFDDQRRLDQLGLDSVLQMVGDAYELEARRLAREISAIFDVSANPAQVAREVVQKVGKGFAWEYVGIFRVARARNRFEVVAEYDATGTQLTVGEQYTQGLDDGMLGATRRLERTLRVGDVRPPQPRPPAWVPPFGYIRTREAQVSAMCVPVRLGGEIEWILDCESSLVDAFHQPDQDAIEALVREVEKTVALWFESRLNGALLDSISQGVVVVDEEHRIERANSAARYLLGFVIVDPTGRALPELGADASDRELLSGAGAQGTTGVHLKLVGADGRCRSVLAWSREPPTTFNRRIWLLSDPAERQWIAGLAHIRATVQSVAAQARGPLLLANALVHRAQRMLPEGGKSPATELLDRASRNLSKTDISYERLTASLAMHCEAVRDEQRVPFSLIAAIQAIIASLPAEDGEGLRLEIPDDLPLLRADPERLRFALRSMLGHLLYIRQPKGEVVLRAKASGGRVTIDAEIAGSPGVVAQPEAVPPEGDVIYELEQEARSTVELASASIAAVVAAHGGHFVHEMTPEGIHIRMVGLDTAPAREVKRP